MGRRKSIVLGLVAAMAMFGSTAHSAQIPQASWPTDASQYDTYVPNWTYMTWGQLPADTSVTVGNYTITPKGSGTSTDPYRFEVSPEITNIPIGSRPNFSNSSPWQNLQELRDWVQSITQSQPTKVAEPSLLAVLLVGLFGVYTYRRKTN